MYTSMNALAYSVPNSMIIQYTVYNTTIIQCVWFVFLAEYNIEGLTYGGTREQYDNDIICLLPNLTV